MRVSRLIASINVLVFATVALAQPPKAAPPRNLPETPASTMPEKTPAEQPAKTNNSPALIKVKVPDNAVIWFENQKMSQSGAQRIFQSPGLEPKKTYYYKVKVSWPTGAGSVTKDFVSEQEVAVRAGETTVIDFTALSSYTKEVKPTSTRDMIRQAAHSTPAPDRNKQNSGK